MSIATSARSRSSRRDGCGRRGRVKTRPEALELFAASLDPRDRVASEVTGNAWAIAAILEAHVARVIVVSPTDTGNRQARAKTDRLDARTLAKLLWAGELDGVWTPDERVRVMRRCLARRAQLVRARSRVKNEIHAVLMRCLKDRPPASDLFRGQGPALAGRSAAGAVRARDRRCRRAPGRLPRQRDRAGRLSDRRRRAVVGDGAPGPIKAIGHCWPASDRQHCAVHRVRNLLAKVPERERERVRKTYWQALDEATGEQDGKQRLKGARRRARPGWLPRRGPLPGRRPRCARRPSALPDPSPPAMAEHEPARAVAR